METKDLKDLEELEEVEFNWDLVRSSCQSH